MRTSLAASLLVALGLMRAIDAAFSALPEDSEGSDFDQDGSGSGSGDWSDQGEITKVMDRPNSEDRPFDHTYWSVKNSGSYVILANSKSLFENEQIVSAIIAGGVTGAILAVILAALLIYKWHNKDYRGFIPGQQTHRGEVF